jgi:hypothetical protein
VRKQSQTMSYSGVGAHHQNGIVEKRIRGLQDLTRTSLLYASTRWPDAVNMYLWPYALLKYNASLNCTDHTKNEETPIEKFTGVKVQPSKHNGHPFGCPTYVLGGPLQN